jgi:hypothetical protein
MTRKGRRDSKQEAAGKEAGCGFGDRSFKRHPEQAAAATMTAAESEQIRSICF